MHEMIRRIRASSRFSSDACSLQGHQAMLHYSCDSCGKDLLPGDKNRFIVKMEAYATENLEEITEAELEPDHVEEMAKILREQEKSRDEPVLPAANTKFRFDLCYDCHAKFLADPLGRECANLHFSKN